MLGAQAVLENDFNSVRGSYEGNLGDPLGTEAALGNATGQRDFDVTSGSGINNSYGVVPAAGDSVAIRSRNFDWDVSQAFSFSMFFQFDAYPVAEGNTTSDGGIFAGMGFLTELAADGVGFNGAGIDRFGFGLGGTLAPGGTEAIFTSNGRINSSSNRSFGAAFALIEGNWYRLAFDAVNDPDRTSLWRVTNAVVEDWGSAGASLVGIVASLPDTGSFDPPNSRNIDGSKSAGVFAYVDDEGAISMDNIKVDEIPEPSVYAFCVGVLALGVVARRRRGFGIGEASH